MKERLMESKIEFFKDGPESRKNPDIIASFKRVSGETIESWTKEQKDNAILVCNEIQDNCNWFLEAIKHYCSK